jgi:hypothetical protein
MIIIRKHILLQTDGTSQEKIKPLANFFAQRSYLIKNAAQNPLTSFKAWWYTLVIPVTQEVENGRITVVQGQSGGGKC